MSASLFSQSWYRVAPLKPRLRSHVQIHHHTYRGQDWFILQDHFMFNGNPLLRFDAYYVLVDYLEIPNLGARGSQYISYLLQKYLLGLEAIESPATTAGEARWLGSYAVTAFIYRILLSVQIIMFVAGKFFVIGILLAGWAGLRLWVKRVWGKYVPWVGCGLWAVWASAAELPHHRKVCWRPTKWWSSAFRCLELLNSSMLSAAMR